MGYTRGPHGWEYSFPKNVLYTQVSVHLQWGLQSVVGGHIRDRKCILHKNIPVLLSVTPSSGRRHCRTSAVFPHQCVAAWCCACCCSPASRKRSTLQKAGWKKSRFSSEAWLLLNVSHFRTTVKLKVGSWTIVGWRLTIKQHTDVLGVGLRWQRSRILDLEDGQAQKKRRRGWCAGVLTWGQLPSWMQMGLLLTINK